MSGTARGAAGASRVRVPGAAIAALVLLVLGVLSLAPAVSTYLAQQREIADTAARIVSQRADLRRLDEQRARWDDPAYVRAQAGSRLFYVTPGTTAYRVIDTRTGSSAVPTPAATAQAGTVPWTDALVRSLVAAGTTTEPER